MELLQEFFASVTRDVDEKLDSLVPGSHTEPRKLHDAVRWSLFAGGKRIRPAILIAVGQAFKASHSQLLHTAAAFEMVHTYSLIHDDLPAMDDDDLRRGKPTCHKQFGEATAILAGDVLQTLAFMAVADDENLPSETRIRLISLLAAASGTPGGMVAGQQRDLEAEGKSLSLKAIEQIHGQKTGALIAAAAVAGAIIGEASNSDIGVIRTYAEKVGLLFQITDDLIDVTQGTDILGKTAGKDASALKATYPGHLGIEKTMALAGSVRDEACDVLSTIDKDTTLLRQLADFILDRTR